MVIYYAMTKFHTIFSILHKFDTHKNENAVIFLYDGMQDIKEMYQRLQKTNIFHNIYLVPEVELRKRWTRLNDKSRYEEIEKDVQVLVEDVEKWLPIQIKKRDTIYLTNDQWGLGTYCIYKKIPYIYYEDGVGMLSKPEYSYELVRKLNITHAIISSYIKAFGQNENVIKKLADLNNQVEGFFDEKAVHFSVKEKLADLSKEDRDKILFIFHSPNFVIEENATLLLTEHFVNMNRLTLEGQRELYALLVDFFGIGKLFIKQHPNDFHIDYKEIFEDATFLARTFPSELLPYCFQGVLELGLTACSTSVLGLSNIFKHIIRFDIDIEKHYKDMICYWAVSKIISDYIEPTEYNIVAQNVYNDLVQAFQIPIVTKRNEAKRNIVIVDKNNILNSQERNKKEELIFFLHPELIFQYFEWDELFFSDFVLMKITKESIKAKYFTSLRKEYILIYTKNKDMKGKISKVEEKKRMDYSGIQLDMEAITDNKEIQIKILEGEIRALAYQLNISKENIQIMNQKIVDLEQELAGRDMEILHKLEKVLSDEQERRN